MSIEMNRVWYVGICYSSGTFPFLVLLVFTRFGLPSYPRSIPHVWFFRYLGGGHRWCGWFSIRLRNHAKGGGLVGLYFGNPPKLLNLLGLGLGLMWRLIRPHRARWLVIISNYILGLLDQILPRFFP